MDVLHVDDGFCKALRFPTVDVDAMRDAVELFTDAVHVPRASTCPRCSSTICS